MYQTKKKSVRPNDYGLQSQNHNLRITYQTPSKFYKRIKIQNQDVNRATLIKDSYTYQNQVTLDLWILHIPSKLGFSYIIWLHLLRKNLSCDLIGSIRIK
jgi:hypothetical protein